MPSPKDIDSIGAYLRAWSSQLGERILQSFPPLHGFNDAPSPLIAQLLRKPFPAQTLAVMGVVRRWNEARGAAVIAECGTGKTLISLGAVHVHSERKPFTALAMVPPQLVEKWAREAFLTLPRVRVFFIDGLRTPTSSAGHAGVNEVRLRHGRIVREGLRTTLTELRLRKIARSARSRWDSICGSPALFIVGRDRGKLSYFWRHAYEFAECGRYQGSVVNPDTGCPIYLGEDGERLLSADFKKAKLSEVLGARNGDESKKLRRPLFGALWQADGKKTRRFAPVDFIGRYMPDFFDYAIADEVHELKGDTAQGNALGTLAACAQHTAVLTGTLLGGYADEVFNILYRLEPGKMANEGFEYGEAGVRAFTETYGLLEKVTVIEPADNACSEARVTKRIRRRPGASPLLFGRFLMSLGAFISLEDISEALPPYREEVLSVEMDAPLKQAYKRLEEEVKAALKEHRGNQSVMSVALNALLLYPDRPFRLGNLYGWEFDPETQRRERFLIAETHDLDERLVYAKERRLVEEVKAELAQARRCLSRSYLVNLMTFQAWGIIYAVLQILISAVNLGSINAVLGANGVLHSFVGSSQMILLALTASIFSFAIALIPFIASRVVSGDIGSTMLTMIGAMTIAASSAAKLAAASFVGVGEGALAAQAGGGGAASSAPPSPPPSPPPPPADSRAALPAPVSALGGTSEGASSTAAIASTSVAPTPLPAAPRGDANAAPANNGGDVPPSASPWHASARPGQYRGFNVPHAAAWYIGYSLGSAYRGLKGRE
jgi:hypothetical protein